MIADHGDFLAEAKAYDRRRTPVATLIQAVANLHPITVDAIMAARMQPA